MKSRHRAMSNAHENSRPLKCNAAHLIDRGSGAGTMISFARDRRHNVTLARFSGEFAADTIGRLDHAIGLLVEAEGPMHFLLDFSAIERVNMPDRAIAERSRRLPLCPGYQRVIVAPQPEILGLYCVFAAGQRAVGASPPVIVRSIAEALRHLGLRRPAFAPIDLPGA
jgi:hypothetical protein